MPGLTEQSNSAHERPHSTLEQGDGSNNELNAAQSPGPRTSFEREFERRLEKLSHRLQCLTRRLHRTDRYVEQLREQLREPSLTRATEAQEQGDSTERSRHSRAARMDEDNKGVRRVSRKSARHQEDEGREREQFARGKEDGGEYTMSGALPTENISPDELLRGTVPNISPPTRRPTRTEVIALIRHEESNASTTLREPDRIRTGSCSGFTISQMLMMRLTNSAVVLPNLYSIEKHHIKALRAWLIDRNLLQNSLPISRTEQLLHCLQLLKSGNRYESIAVMFSRSPRQVKDGCLEAMEGLLRMYSLLVDEAENGAQDPGADTWGILKRFDKSADGRGAQMYYGFSWTRLVKVLVALDVFFGLSRRASRSPAQVSSPVTEDEGMKEPHGSALEPVESERADAVGAALSIVTQTTSGEPLTWRDV